MTHYALRRLIQAVPLLLGITVIAFAIQHLAPGDPAWAILGPQLDRLRRRALEAVKQSGNPWACAVEDPVSLDQFLARPAAGLRWLADPAGVPPASTLGDEPVTVLVGPEGGLSGEERAAAAAAGYQPVSLGPHVLRFETAAIAAAAAVQAARSRGRHA